VPTSEARAKRVIDQIACGGHCHKQHEIIRGAPGAALMGASRRYRRRIDRARRHWPVPELDVRGRIITPRGRDALGRLIEGVALALETRGCTCGPNLVLTPDPGRPVTQPGTVTRVTVEHDDYCPMCPRGTEAA